MVNTIGGVGGVNPTPPPDKSKIESLVDDIEELRKLIEKFSKDFKESPEEFKRALDKLEKDAKATLIPPELQATLL